MPNYNILFAITAGATCLWCQLADRKGIAEWPEEGEHVDLLLRAYRTLRQTEFPADQADAKEKLEEVMSKIGFQGRYPSTDFRPMPLEELEKEAARWKLNLACRYDLETKDFTVSTGPDMLHPALAIPGSMDQALAEQALTSAKAIGFALGTKRSTWNRQFREPWKAIAKCLASSDPGEALQAAADGDILGRKAWIETAAQSARTGVDLPNETLCKLAARGKAAFSMRETKNLDGMTQVVSVRVAEAFGPGTRPAVLRLLERDGKWYLCLPDGHCYCKKWARENVLAGQDLQVRTPYGGQEGLAQMLSLLDSRGGEDGFRSLRELAAAIELAYAARNDNFTSWGSRLFDWRARDILRDYQDGETILPAEVCGLTWGELRRWMDTLVSECSFYRHDERISGTPGPKDGEDLLLLCGDTASAMSYQQLRDYIRRECRTALTELRTRFAKCIRQSESWQNMEDNLAGLGQRVHAVDPLAGIKIASGVLEYDGAQFCVAYEGRPMEPVQDILDRGTPISATWKGVTDRVDELGREYVWCYKALEPCYDLSDEDKERISEQFPDLTVPAGWAYVYAKFRDGRYGIAYGPVRKDEGFQEGQRRILREAKKLSSASALCVLDI